MSYSFTKTLEGKTFEEAVALITKELANEGFGVLSTIDIKQTLKIKINADFKRYTILGACNPSFANILLNDEYLMGLFLPCNVVVQEDGENKIKVSAIDPSSFIDIVSNKSIENIILQIRDKLSRAIESIA